MKLDITLAIPGLPFNGATFDTLSIGGSESAGYFMARALAKLGHRVTCFTNGEPLSCADVDYAPMAMFRQYLEYTKHDVCIVQRVPEMFAPPHQARFSALWCHDLAMVRAENKIKGVSWNFDKVFVLSKFMREQYQSIYGFPEEFLYQTRNGVDLAAVEATRAGLRDRMSRAGTPIVEIPRDPFRLVYAARPERGLDVLLGEIMPASQAGQKHAQELSWDGVAKEWSELFESQIRESNSDKSTLLNHFWRQSDILVARELMKEVPEDDAKSQYVRDRIKKDWAFLDEEDGFRKQYERIGATHDAAVINWSPTEPRFQALMQWLGKNKDIRNVLDYGCAHGAYATNLMKNIPDLSVTGVDIDKRGIAMAADFAKQLGVTDRWKGIVGDYTALQEPQNELGADFDCALVQEVLEHVPEPWKLLRALETKVKDGGIVYITVPFGPWEYTDYNRYPHRAHIWEFDLHDLHEMLDVKGKEAETTIFAMPAWREPFMQAPLGWWVVQYKVTPETRGKVGSIDLQRKLWLQRPRQTVSLDMIAGEGSSEQILWGLNSVEHLADEVIIVDCGMNDTDKAVLALSKVADRIKIVPRDYMLMNQYEFQQNGGVVTEEMKERCRQAIALYRKYFIGKGFFANIDPHTYYSQALGMLGEGFDLHLAIAADKIQAKPNGALQGRFASVEEAITEATRRIKEAAGQFDNKYY